MRADSGVGDDQAALAGGPPHLIALDWGTSNLRAFLMRAGEVVATRSSGHGIQHLPRPGVPGYEMAFAQIAGDWVSQWPAIPVVASGMVGSVRGWREAPYIACPADEQALAGQRVVVPSGLGPDILIAPGVALDRPGELPDVMRGEEIQVAGALRLYPQWQARSCLLLPGTHSKWVHVEAGRIVRFATYLTGELFAILRRHSIVGQLMPAAHEPEAAMDLEAFTLGLSTARQGGAGDLLHQLFGARALGLAGRVPSAGLADYLSGLLIGSELISGLAAAGGAEAGPLVVIGAPALCDRYVRALGILGRPVGQVLDNAAPVGLWHLALAAGLVRPVSSLAGPCGSALNP